MSCYAKEADFAWSLSNDISIISRVFQCSYLIFLLFFHSCTALPVSSYSLGVTNSNIIIILDKSKIKVKKELEQFGLVVLEYDSLGGIMHAEEIRKIINNIIEYNIKEKKQCSITTKVRYI